MEVELSKHEVEMINKGLECWETDAITSTIIIGLMLNMLCPKGRLEDEARKFKEDMTAASRECQKRKEQSLLLRAKLFQVLNKDSENLEEAHLTL